MSPILQRTCVFLVIAMLSACASQPPHQRAAFNKFSQETLPAISVFYGRPGDELRNECAQFDQASAFNNCTLHPFDLNMYVDSLRSSGLFSEVYYANENTDYSIVIASTSFLQEDAADLTKAVVSGLSMMMIPMDNESVVKSEVSVLWRGALLKQFQYELPYHQQMALYKNLHEQKKDFVDSLASHILHDVQGSQVLASHYLYSTLNASDYMNHLAVPFDFSEFSLLKKELLPDPFAGVLLRYRHNFGVEGNFDAFVYPIMRVDWDNLDETLQFEDGRIRKELELAIKKGLYTSSELTPTQTVRWRNGDKDYQGLEFHGVVALADQAPMYTYVYLFLKQDKFIKLRISCPGSECSKDSEAFARSVVFSIEPPPESLFMAELRQQQRSKTVQN